MLQRPLLALALSLATGFVPGVALAGEIVSPDMLVLGLKTRPQLEHEPCGYRVSWIKWDSGFRASLQVGDRIVAVDGVQVPCPPRLTLDPERDRPTNSQIRELTQWGPGGVFEAAAWKERGLKDGAKVRLTVLRRPADGDGTRPVDASGILRAARTYTDERGRTVLGAGGPPSTERDAFPSTWGRWYEDFTDQAERVLDGGWRSTGFDNRRLLAEHLAHRERVDFLAARYPGPFSSSIREDWERVRIALLGRQYRLSETDRAHLAAGAVPPTINPPAADATPRQVMEVFVAAAKWGADPAWRSTLATWRLTGATGGAGRFEPSFVFSPGVLEGTFERVAGGLKRDVLDIRVA
jgi:hypothetical protein